METVENVENRKCQIHIQTTTEVKKKLEERAKDFGCNVSTYIKSLIADDLKNTWRER